MELRRTRTTQTLKAQIHQYHLHIINTNPKTWKSHVIFRLLVQDVLSVDSHWVRFRLRVSLVIAVRAFISGLDSKPIHSSLFFLSLVARTEFCSPFSLLSSSTLPPHQSNPSNLFAWGIMLHVREIDWTSRFQANSSKFLPSQSL